MIDLLYLCFILIMTMHLLLFNEATKMYYCNRMYVILKEAKREKREEAGPKNKKKIKKNKKK